MCIRDSRYAKQLSCHDQFLIMCMAQYADKNSLRDIEASLIALEYDEAANDIVVDFHTYGKGYEALMTQMCIRDRARILKPDDFGVIAICNMLVFFADIITDAGFGKYIVQAD